MVEASSGRTFGRRALVLWALSGGLAVAAVAVGVDDNPPGLSLAFLSGAALATGIAHTWPSPKIYRHLMYASGFGFLASGVLHNVLHALASVPELPMLAYRVLTGGSVVFFFIAILVCPPFFVVGAVGAIVTWLRRGDS